MFGLGMGVMYARMRDAKLARECRLCAWAHELLYSDQANLVFARLCEPLRCGGCKGNRVVRWWECVYEFKDLRGHHTGRTRCESMVDIDELERFCIRYNGQLISAAEMTRRCTDCTPSSHRHSRRAKKLFRRMTWGHG